MQQIIWKNMLMLSEEMLEEILDHSFGAFIMNNNAVMERAAYDSIIMARIIMRSL